MAKAEPRRSLIGAKIGNYSIVSQLGEGGMGVVYLAEHPQIGKRVAIKVLHADHAARTDAAQRAFLEARAVNEIRHPNVVDIIDCGIVEIEDDSVHYLLMEYLEGESLRALINRGAVPFERATEIAVEVAKALAAAHAKGIIHRDIKPENIFLAREADADVVKVLDFGIAKLLDGRAFGERLTQSGVTLGTPQYMAPEQLDAEDVDGRADVYALGIVIYEMLVGAAPFSEETTARGVWRRMNELPTLTDDLRAALPAGFEDLLMRTLDPDRIRRPEMADLARALVDPSDVELPAAGGDPHTVRIAKATANKPKQSTAAQETRSAPTVDELPPRRSRLPLVLGAIAALGTIAVIVVFATRDPEPKATPSPSPSPTKVAPTAEIVTIQIVTSPPGAEVFVGAESAPRGIAPIEVALVKNSQAEIRCVLAGYHETRRSIGTLRDGAVEVTLAKLPKTDATPAGTKPARPTIARPTPSPPMIDAGVAKPTPDADVRRGDDLPPP